MSTAQQRRPSLIWHLMAWMLGALVVVWASFVALGYQTGVHEADELTDGHLAGVAALVLNLEVAGAVGQGAATPVHEPPGLMAHDYQQSLSVALWDGAGRLISRTGDAPEPAFDTEQGFATLRLGPEHRAWRSFTQWSRDHARKVSVMIELQERDELADDIAGQMIEPGLWLLPVVALALGLAIRRGMRPLNELSREVERLDLAQAERVSHRHALREFMPVVNSINTLLDRQQEALERERSLANEVAHELRTPLASIALQARALGDAPAGASPRARACKAMEASGVRSSWATSLARLRSRSSASCWRSSKVLMEFTTGMNSRSAWRCETRSAWARSRRSTSRESSLSGRMPRRMASPSASATTGKSHRPGSIIWPAMSSASSSRSCSSIITLTLRAWSRLHWVKLRQARCSGPRRRVAKPCSVSKAGSGASPVREISRPAPSHRATLSDCW